MALGVALGVAEGGGCRDKRRGSSASEVGTADGTAKKEKKKKEEEVCVCLMTELFRSVKFSS